MRFGRDVEELTCSKLDDSPVIESRRRRARHDKSNVLDSAALLPQRGTDMLRPPPARLVRRSAERHATEPNKHETTLHEFANLVRLLEALQDDVLLQL